VIASTNSRIASRCVRCAGIASAAVISIGVIVIAGWVFDLSTVQRLHPALTSMKINTALSLALLGGALRASIVPGTPRRTRVLALAACAIATASLLEYAFGADLGIDELLSRDPTTVGLPGRMSPTTAACILTLGVAIASMESSWAEWLALVVALTSQVALLGYFYGVRDLYAIGPYASVALHTAVALYVLAFGVVLARPGRGLMQLFTNDLAGGVLARQLVPAAMVVPTLLALLRQWGEHGGLYGEAFGRAMLVACNIVVLVGLILWTAAALSRSDLQRRGAADVIRKSEAHLGVTLASIGDAVIATDMQGRVELMNPVAQQLTGWPTTDALGRPLAEVFRIVDEDTGRPVESPVDRVLRDGVVVGLANHTILVARDGTERAISDSGAPIRDALGTTSGVVLVFHDQSDVRAAQRGLRESKARKAAILESALDAIISVDGSGVVMEFNPAAETMFRRARGEVVGRALADVIPMEPGNGRHHLVHALVSGEPSVLGKRSELIAVRSDGSAFPAEISVTRVNLEGPPSFTGFIRDVTDATRARAELTQSHDRLRALAGVSDALAMVATSYQALLDKIAETSAALVGDGCFVTLISDDEATLVSVANAHRDPTLAREYRSFVEGIIVPVTSPGVGATVARTGRPQHGDTSPSAMVARSDEAIRPIVARLNVHSFAVVPVRARHRVIGALSLLRSTPGRSYTDEDVTLMQDLADRAGLAIENARLYNQLEQRVRERTAALASLNHELRAVNQELETFSYSVAHDLRAPLRAISGFGELILEGHATQLDAEGLHYFARIRHAALRGGHLIDDLLNLAQVGRAAPHLQNVELSKLAHAVADRLRASEPDRIVEITIEEGLVAWADPRLLEIVLTNLLGNAWKFTGKREQARIELAAVQTEQATTYLVRDNGAGFEAAYTEKLFGVFQRLHTEHEFEGTGIGLATVRRVIQRHGGRIWAAGAVDEGATFFFTLET